MNTLKTSLNSEFDSKQVTSIFDLKEPKDNTMVCHHIDYVAVACD